MYAFRQDDVKEETGTEFNSRPRPRSGTICHADNPRLPKSRQASLRRT